MLCGEVRKKGFGGSLNDGLLIILASILGFHAGWSEGVWFALVESNYIK